MDICEDKQYRFMDYIFQDLKDYQKLLWSYLDYPVTKVTDEETGKTDPIKIGCYHNVAANKLTT